MAQISLRIDDEVKHSAEQVLDDIGLSMSAAITVFLRTVARERRIPFELSAEPNSVTYAAMEAADNNDDIYGPFDSVEKMMEELNA